MDGEDQLPSEEISLRLTRIESKLDQILEQLAGSFKEYFTTEQLGKLAARSTYTIRRWRDEGKLKGIRMEASGPHGPWLFHRDEVQRLMNSGQIKEIPGLIKHETSQPSFTLTDPKLTDPKLTDPKPTDPKVDRR